MLDDHISIIRQSLENPEALNALAHLEKEIAKVDWRISYLAMNRLVEAGELDDIPFWIDRVEDSLRDYFVVYPGQEEAFKTDVETFTSFSRKFVEMGNLDGLSMLMDIFPDLFNVNGKQKCGAIKSRCRSAGYDRPNKCTYKFSTGEMVCPECGDPRSLCLKPVLANGRCRVHGGYHSDIDEKALALNRNDRGLMYQNAFNNEKLSARFKAALNDPNYLSLAPEIALISSRIAGLIEEVEDIDYQAIKSKVESELRKMEKSVSKGNLDEASTHAHNILFALNQDVSYRKSWESIAGLTSILKGLTEADRRRIVDAQRIITIEEMLQLRNRTTNLVVEAVEKSSRLVISDIVKALRIILGDDEATRLVVASTMRESQDSIEEIIRKRMIGTIREVMERERGKERRALDMKPEVIDG